MARHPIAPIRKTGHSCSPPHLPSFPAKVKNLSSFSTLHPSYLLLEDRPTNQRRLRPPENCLGFLRSAFHVLPIPIYLFFLPAALHLVGPQTAMDDSEPSANTARSGNWDPAWACSPMLLPSRAALFPQIGGAAGEAISVLIKAVALIGAISAYVSDGRRGRLADGDLIFPFFPFSCFSFCFSSFRLQNSPDGPCPSVEGKLSCFR